MNRRALIGFLLAIVPGLAAAKRYFVTPGQFGFYTPPTRRTVTIRVAFLDEDPPEMRTRQCRGGAGCMLENTGNGPHVVIAPRPKDFEDEYACYVLGHELLHALGARHG